MRLGAARVILGCRSTSKGATAKKNIEATTGVLGVIDVWQVDLGSWESVKQFCERAGQLDRLDAVVENAGVATPKYEKLEGTESTIAINVIGTFLMALLMLPHLRRSGIQHNVVPRLTIVASDAHEQVRALSHLVLGNFCDFCFVVKFCFLG